MEQKMYHAVASDSPGTLRRLLDRGANPDELYQDLTAISGKSILHMCCEKGRLDCVKILLEKGAYVSIPDTWYQTPLMYCMLTQYPEVAELLLERDPYTVDVGDKYGKSALHIAVEVGSLECVQVLLRNDADVDIATDYGVTPLMTVCSCKDLPAETVVSIVRLLLEAGADTHLKDHRNKRTALQMATISKNIKAIELLLSAGSDPNTIDSAGRNPITNILRNHMREISRNIDPDVLSIIMMLVQAGADLNRNSHEHSNAVVMAALAKSPELMKYFLENGGDQNTNYLQGISPLIVATSQNDIRTLKVLLNWNSDLYLKGRVKRRDLDYFTDAFHLAIDMGHFEAAMLLVDAGYQLSRVDYLVDRSLLPPNTLIDNQAMLDWFRCCAKCVQTLSRIVILEIRKLIKGDLKSKAELLPLPKLLISAIHMKQELT